VSQQYPSKIVQLQQSDIKSQVLDSPVGKQIFKSSACEMMELEIPSMSQSLIGGIPYAGRCQV